MRTFLRVLVVALTALIACAVTATTTASAATFAYDVPTIARADAQEFDTADASLVQPSDALDVAASPSVEGRGASTTPLHARNATESAGAAGSSIEDLLKPGGSLIGKAGTDETIRELTGGLPDAQAMFQQLGQGGRVVEQTSTITRVELANNGGFVQLRTVMSRSPGTAATIDVNIPGLDITKLKFNP